MLSAYPVSIGIRHADRADVADIFRLIESLTSDGTLLRRSEREIAQQLSSFIVARGEEGEFLGCAALHRYGKHLAEIRSIAVRPEARGLGAGGRLLEHLLAELRESGTRCACLFTRVPSFFAHYGFHDVPLASFTDKVAKDCVHCPRRSHCDEIAMALGELPSPLPAEVSPLQAGRLVQL